MFKFFIALLLVYLCVIFTLLLIEFPKYQEQMIRTIKSQEYKVTYTHPVLTTEEIILGINRANFLWNNYELLFKVNPQDTSLMLFFGGTKPGKFRREMIKKEDLCADVLKALKASELKQKKRKTKYIPQDTIIRNK